ncbi:endonuclease NucS domain-containing protein [Azospirillum formosense]|uniref:endonuclease NucS domain-containing protein n=1 Tax=Azospirillum formosense TaxID=861533 RepID=UPI00338F13F5
MQTGYRAWLERQKYGAGTVTAQIYRIARVEEHYGDVDEHYVRDRMASLLQQLRYSTDDARLNRPNPSKIPIEGDIRANLASYRGAIERYRRFRDTADALADVAAEGMTVAIADEDLGQRIGLERDLQAALRLEIGQLEAGMTVIDEGAERSVPSGFIDITARDAQGRVVVIELKTGTAGQRAVAQILSYMGDIAEEEEGRDIRGILVASDFDAKAKAAARMVPNLSLRRYGVRFSFADGSL